MAASRQMRKLFSSVLPSSCKRSERAYSAAAAMAVQDYEYWQLPLPVMLDTHGQRTGRGPQWIFLGSPGVGKATYASRLAKLLNVPHISMGNLLRKEASMSTAFSKEIHMGGDGGLHLLRLRSVRVCFLEEACRHLSME